MIGLIRIEFFKLFRQRRTYLSLIAILIIEIVVLAVAYFQGSEILDTLLESLKDSFYFKGDLLNGNLLAYLLLNSLWFHFPLILMIIVSGMITSEYEDKTLQTVFLQPVSKTKFLLSKYITAAIFTVGTVFILALTAFVFCYVLFGTGDLIVYLDGLNFFPQQEAFRRLCLAFATGAVSMVLYTVASLTIGVFLRQTIKTWIIAAVFLIVSNLFTQVNIPWLYLDQWFYAEFNTAWQYFFYFDIPAESVVRSLLGLVVYIGLFSWIGVRAFKKQDIG